MVEERAALLHGRLGQVDGQAGIVKLPVVVEHAAPQAVGLEVAQAPQRFLLAQVHRGPQAELAGQQVVHRQADGIVRPAPPVVVRNDKILVFHQVRRVAQQQAPLVKRLAHQRNVALGQVAHAAVHQLGAAAAGALGVINLLEQQRFVAPADAVEGHAQARRAAANHYQIPDGLAGQLLQQRGPRKGCLVDIVSHNSLLLVHLAVTNYKSKQTKQKDKLFTPY